MRVMAPAASSARLGSTSSICSNPSATKIATTMPSRDLWSMASGYHPAWTRLGRLFDGVVEEAGDCHDEEGGGQHEGRAERGRRAGHAGGEHLGEQQRAHHARQT